MVYAFWFRKDLRVFDNKALSEFISFVKNRFKPGQDSILLFYIKNNYSSFCGEKRIEFLRQCLCDLQNSLKSLGFNLVIFKGRAFEIIKHLADQSGGVFLFANKQYEPYSIERDNLIKNILDEKNSKFYLYHDLVIFPPDSIYKDDGKPYVVYTPYNKKVLNLLTEELYTPYDTNLKHIKQFAGNQYKVDSLKYPFCDINKPEFNGSLIFKGGRKEGLKILNNFTAKKISDYKKNRDYPAVNGTSLLSSHLHFGTVSPRECFNPALKNKKNFSEGIKTWINELIWREFYYQITFNFPYIINGAFKKEYNNIEWENDKNKFDKWCSGLTGYPIVDAGMRQLTKEGWMHNRVRMITAMFLTKDLLIDWKWGEKFFAQHLIDLDFANNNGGWQWSASTGCDAQPYFRIFNPYLQSIKYDHNGEYIKKYLPELKTLDKKIIHKPDLKEINLSIKYPEPIVDHFKMKEIAIGKYKNLKTIN